MTLNRIKDELKRRHVPVTKFIKETVQMSVPGFNDAIERDTLPVRKLRIISKALDVPVAYWFEDTPMMAEETASLYGNNLMAEIERLRKQVDDLIDDKIRLKDQIDQLMKRK